MKKVRVHITEEENDYIERLFFEHTSLLNILKFLSSSDGTKKEYFESYMEDAKKQGVELELAKLEISQLHAPVLNEYKYFFDFVNNDIVYEVNDCEKTCQR